MISTTEAAEAAFYFRWDWRAVISMRKKVVQWGNHLSVPLTEALKKIGLDLGDEVHVDVRVDVGEIVIRKVDPKITETEGSDPQFFKTLRRNVEKYRGTLEGLKYR